MFTTIVAVALLTLCIVVSGVAAFLALRRTNTDPRAEAVARYFTVGAITAVGSSAMHMFAVDAAPSTVTLVFGDVAMMCGPGMLYVALSAVTGRARRALIAVAGGVVVLGIAVALLPYPVAVGVRGVLLAVFGLLAVRESVRPGVRGRGGMRIVRVVMSAFSAYMLAAAAAGIVAPDAALTAAVFSFAPMTVVGIVAIAAISVAAVLLLRDLQRPDATVDADAAGVRVRESVSIPDFAYMPTAYGHAQAEALELALLEACRSVDPAAERLRAGTVVFSAGADASASRARVRTRFAALVASEHTFVEALAFAPAR